MELNEYKEVLYKVIVQNQKHKHYTKKAKIRKWLLQINTGDDQKEMIVRWRQKESNTQKEQRVRVYNSRTPQVANKAMSYYHEVHRTEDFKEVMEYEGDKDQKESESKKKLVSASENFYAKKTVREYLHKTHLTKNFYDPNSWLVVEWESKDQTSKTKFYPFEVAGEDVLDFRFDYGDLEYLVIRKEVDIWEDKEKNKKAKGWKYTLYGKKWTIVGYENKDDIDYVDAPKTLNEHNEKEGGYLYQAYDNKLDEVQAAPFGFIEDPECDGYVFLSPLHPSKTGISRLVNRTSTLDISIACHGFLQKFVYANPCNHSVDDEEMGRLQCIDGELGDKKCPKCKGSGMQIHASDQDVVYLPLPDSPDVQIIPLSNLVYYAQIDKELIKLQREEVQDAIRDCLSTIFNENVFEKSEVATTATENMLNWRSVNNTLSPYADHDAQMYEFVIRIMAKHLGIEKGLNHSYKYPSDYHLESLQELIQQRKELVESNAPIELIKNIDLQILKKQVKDNKDFIMNWQAKLKFKPFADKSNSEVLLVINSLPPDHYKVILHYNYNEIFTEIFEDHEQFHALGYTEQKKIVDKMVDDFRGRKNAIVPEPENILANAG